MSPADIPEGYESVWVPDDGRLAGRWKIATPEERRAHGCRWTVGPGNRQCGLPPVAALLRGPRRPSWWFYCSSHLYGRRIRNGVVEQRIIRKVGGE